MGILSVIVSTRVCLNKVDSRTLQRVLDDGDNSLELFRGQVSGALGKVDIGLLADQVRVSATDTLDLGQGVHDLLLAIDVRVQQTDDVLEAVPGSACTLDLISRSSLPRDFPLNLSCQDHCHRRYDILPSHTIVVALSICSRRRRVKDLRHRTHVVKRS